MVFVLKVAIVWAHGRGNRVAILMATKQGRHSVEITADLLLQENNL